MNTFLRFLIFFQITFLSSLFACECGEGQPYPIHGREWVIEKIKEHPEILWLADADVRKTEEGICRLNGSFSEQLFGQKFIEFDRTVMTLHCLELILEGSEGSYHELTCAQPKEEKLSRFSFLELYGIGKKLLSSNEQELNQNEVAKAMQAALVLGDIGKSEKARKVFNAYGARAIDHDDYYKEVIAILMQYPELSVTFSRLSESAKQLLYKTASLAHYGHITHLEGDFGLFSKIKESRIAQTDFLALSFDLFVHCCDVMGALGHVNCSTSLVYTEKAHRAMQAVMTACALFKDPKITEEDAYMHYLSRRAAWLGFNPNNATDRILTRVGAMLRLFTKEEGKYLKKGMSHLTEKEITAILTQFDPTKKERPTPTYMPLVLVNMLYNHKSKEEGIAQAIAIGLPFLAHVLEKDQSHSRNNSNPLNFNHIGGIVKTNPQLLVNADFSIDAEGYVTVKDR